ncbi:putative NADH:ubiquinone oxidoreductase 17.2 kd subunit [Serpula lacrymans var. lacrymans S7.9]|uniref:NADH dehydrogenase [ubiquinone] 1 alpha subcomplex subunit n=1 Tax=Serpula lacrymans var. lacrymans (strain S7.9) TaxID=578457 RepID=F8NLW1_SERL9|nr:putative NADH:ubiquinone oxidoreductase 17.2 kd subunit [Serpula lacrymans var. lacrymans S7.9]EGO28136.1 putative NADH:ubiquinone oxidoreductase 17.2 kd subunit [Serpula lacrymans var. lacrymans S7.9]
MVSIIRYVRNIRRTGIAAWWRNMQYIGDAKAGTYVGKDQFGNRYYENLNPEDEIPGRHRWVDFAQHYSNATQVPAEWHSWLSHIRQSPPPEDNVIQNLSPVWQGVSLRYTSDHQSCSAFLLALDREFDRHEGCLQTLQHCPAQN